MIVLLPVSMGYIVLLLVIMLVIKLGIVGLGNLPLFSVKVVRESSSFSWLRVVLVVSVIVSAFLILAC